MASQSTASNLLPSGPNAKLIIGAAVAGVAAAGAGYLIYQKIKNTPPKEWRQVGELTELIYYPIKSCGPIRVKQLECGLLGGGEHGVVDRTFMVMNEKDKEFVHARTHPKMVLIQPRLENGKMILSAPGMPDVTVDYQSLRRENPLGVKVWGNPVDTLDCGDEVAKWLSKYILDKDSGLRLVHYFKDIPTRPVHPDKKLLGVRKVDLGALHDETSYMLFNQKSVDELNERVTEKVDALRFRPNFVVKGPEAFEEDTWKWIKIGDVVFKYSQPCLRCIFTNINPETGERNPEGQPLKTLKSYRKFKKYGESPWFGVHFGIHTGGVVKIGDPIYVET